MANNSTAIHDREMNGYPPQTFTMGSSRRQSRSSSQAGSQHRHSVRIEKPRNSHQSPRPADRRRTTMAATKRHTILDEHFNLMFGNVNEEPMEEVVQRRPSVRPVSWHPSTQQHLPGHSYTPRQPVPEWTDLFRNQEPDCMSQATSYSVHGSAFPFPPGQYLPTGYASGNITPAINSSYNSPSWNDMPSMPYTLQDQPAQNTLQMQPTPWSVQDWVQMTHAPQRASHNSPSPQIFSSPPEKEEEPAPSSPVEEDSGEVKLVGLGLYDPPEGYDSWFASGQVEGTGRGLKLEETWEPPAQDEEDDDEEDDNQDGDNDNDMQADADDASTDDVSEKLPVPADPSMMTQGGNAWAPYQNNNYFPGNMAGKSFFFEGEVPVNQHYWNAQVPQPMAHPEPAVFGYNWI